MSALTHSPGFLDFLTIKPGNVFQTLARSIAPIASIASFIPGLGEIARPIAGALTALGGGDVAALVEAPSASVVSTIPQVPAMGMGPEEEEPPPGYESWEDYYSDPDRG